MNRLLKLNTAHVSALGPILTTLVVGLDVRFEWGMGTVMMTAFASLIMWLLTAMTPDTGYVAVTTPPSQTTLKSVAWLAVLITAILMLTGCVSSLTPHGGAINSAIDSGIEQTIKDVKRGNDRIADLSSQVAGCGITLGAWGRSGQENMVRGYGQILMCPEAYNFMVSLNQQFGGVVLPQVEPVPQPLPPTP